MHGMNDLGVVEPAQIHRGDREIGVPEFALDDQQRHPLAGHLHRVGMAQLVRREPAAQPPRRWRRRAAGSVRRRATTGDHEWGLAAGRPAIRPE
jgi:hypothetical protein